MLAVTFLVSVGRWYLVILLLHRFFVIIVRTVVNHGVGGIARVAVVWSAGPSLRSVEFCRLSVTLLCYLDLNIWGSQWWGVVLIVARLFSVSLLVKIVAFLGTLHWLAKAEHQGNNVSLMLSVPSRITFEAGERLALEKAVPRRRRGRRQISVSPVLFC